jgi:sigma-B regulation protein RsbU (phosphoserine phosphatase)
VLQFANGHITRLQKTAQFVTALYGTVNSESREFAYARAGHEPPVLLKPDGSVERIPHGPGMSLGLWEDIVLDLQVVHLPPGSTLLLFTDGMTDCRDPKGVQFGISRINETLSTLVGLPAQVACDRLLQTLKDYQAGSNQDDDVTLVAIHSA